MAMEIGRDDYERLIFFEAAREKAAEDYCRNPLDAEVKMNTHHFFPFRLNPFTFGSNRSVFFFNRILDSYRFMEFNRN